jgi:GT2 family glycosyltransferase
MKKSQKVKTNSIYPKVSLIIPNLNGRELLHECLLSLKKIDYPNYEIIVSDGGSIDGIYEMIHNEFPNVILVMEKNAGIGRSNNLGMKVATGEIIAFDLNNDEIFERDWLKKLVEVLLSSQEIGVVGGTRIVYGTKSIVDEGGYRFSFLGFARNNQGIPFQQLPRSPQNVDFVGIPVFRKSLIKMIGMCDEQYQIYFEDSDFCMSAKKAGFKIVWVPKAISYHRRHTTTPRHYQNLTFVVLRNRLRFIIKHFSKISIFPAILFQVLFFPIMRLFYSIFLYSLPVFNSEKILNLLYVEDSKSYIKDIFKAFWWNTKVNRI